MKRLSKTQCEALLSAHERMLVLFSGDQRLVYSPYEEGDTFVLRPDQQKVLVPLSFFEDNEGRENRLLFHLYQTLALYPDWQKSPSAYLHRLNNYNHEIETAAKAYLEKVKEEGLEKDPAYTPALVKDGVRRELNQFLEEVDNWAASLIVCAKAPVYQNESVRKEIRTMLAKENVFPYEDSDVHTHRDLAGCLMVMEFFDAEEIGNEKIRTFLTEPVLERRRYDFLVDQLSLIEEQKKGIAERDALIHAFLMPAWVSLFKEDISHMKLIRTQLQKSRDQEHRPSLKKHAALMKDQDKQAMLKELENQQKRKAQADLVHGSMDLDAFGVTAKDKEIYLHYERAVRAARNEMKQFWQKLIGEASQEESQKITGMDHGKLDVPLLINTWPDFTEVQAKGNYKDLRVFDDYELVKVPKQLPKELDISFVIDNSGSMKSGKVPYAREALAIVLLSLQDFAAYLMTHADMTHQQMHVSTETWLFGTKCKRILSFEDTQQKKKADTILSISRLDGSAGSTDDGACLNKILKEITPKEERELQTGKRIRLIFEVTAGASSFPGTTKKAVQALIRKGVEIQALEMGVTDDPEAKRIFSYIFEDHGTFLGSQVEYLPKALMSSVQKQIYSVFHGLKV